MVAPVEQAAGEGWRDRRGAGELGGDRRGGCGEAVHQALWRAPSRRRAPGRLRSERCLRCTVAESGVFLVAVTDKCQWRTRWHSLTIRGPSLRKSTTSCLVEEPTRRTVLRLTPTVQGGKCPAAGPHVVDPARVLEVLLHPRALGAIVDGAQRLRLAVGGRQHQHLHRAHTPRIHLDTLHGRTSRRQPLAGRWPSDRRWAEIDGATDGRQRARSVAGWGHCSR
jgi:hypothetical protein